MFDDRISKKVVGHVLLNLSILAAKYLQFLNHRARVFVPGFGNTLLTIFFAETWLKKALEKLDNSLNVKVKECVK